MDKRISTEDRYRNAVRFLEGLSNLPQRDYMRDRKDPSVYIARTRDFLARIGSPERGPKYIHVTGTSGKGSVSCMLAEVVRAGGHRVGLFTSPFSTTTIEKIAVDGQYISPAIFADIVDELKPHIARAHAEGEYGGPSYFELILAIGLLYFKRMRCDWVVLEVGCGGRYDATNVIPAPVVSAITNIDYDHTHILGKTLTKIAWDKAGIIKKGSAFFTSEPRARLRKIMEKICRAQRVPMHLVRSSDAPDVLIAMPGAHQHPNIALVAAIGRHLGLSDTAIGKGIARARMPCRFEVMARKPLVVLDGAHSPAKIRATAMAMKALNVQRIFLLFGCAENKDASPMLEAIVPLASTILVTRFQTAHRKAAHPAVLAQQIKKYARRGATIITRYDPHEALAEARRRAGSRDAIVVTGSFFLAGELRAHWYPESVVLQKRRSF